MLDALPPAVRHAILMLLVALLTWAQTGIPGLERLPLPLQGLIGTLVTLALAALTPLTTQYGAATRKAVVNVGNAIGAGTYSSSTRAADRPAQGSLFDDGSTR